MCTMDILIDRSAQTGEGLAWDAHSQLLYWVDIPRATIFVFDPVKRRNRSIDLSKRFSSIGTVAPRQSGGLIFTPERKIAHLNLQTEEVTILAEVEQDLPGNRFNDGKCDPAGRFLTGTMKDQPDGEPSGALYILDADLQLRKLRGDLVISNGMGWSPDFQQFYLADSFSPDIWAYDYDLQHGEILNQRVAFRLDEGMGVADGLTTDCEGMVWLALWDGACVTRWNPGNGKLLATYRFPAKRITNCVFGGKAMRDLYVASAAIGLCEQDWQDYPHNGALFRLQTPITGMPTFAFAG